MTSPTPPVCVVLTVAGLLSLPAAVLAGPRHTKPTTVEVQAAPRRATAAAGAASAAAGPALHADRFRRQLRARVTRMNDQAIAILLRLIEATSDDDPDKPDLLFRLAEHYREKKVDHMFRARELDEAVFRARSAADRAAIKRRQQAHERAERRWLLRAAQTYVKVASASAFASYRRMDAVLFNLADLLSQARRRDRARIFFRRLIRNYPQSPFIPDAYLSFAEYYFGAGQVEAALRLYDKVGRYPDSPLYGYALYKQGWCWLNLKQPQRALERFVQVIRRGTKGKGRRRARIELIREAKKDAVRAYAAVGSPDKAWAFFSRVGGSYAPRMLEHLAGLYHDQGKFLPAIQTYRKLMALRPRSDDLCAWQHSVLRATLPGKDKRQQLVEARRLAAVHAALRKRGAGARVLRRCRDNAAGVLRELATLWHRECQVTKNMGTCGLAGQLYQEYLARYPGQKDAYRLRFYLAELLFALERWRPSAGQYSKVVAMRPQGEHLAAAAYGAVVALKNALDEGRTPPDAAAVRRRHRAAAARQNIKTPQPIPPAERELMGAFATYLRAVPRSPERVSILYREGRMLYARNHYRPAIERFARLIKRYPKHELAVYAANLLLDSLNILGRHDALERWALRLQRHPVLGQGDLKGDVDRVLFGVRWKKAEAARKAGHYRRCGEAFAKLANDYQDHQRWPQMLHNAALCFEAAKLVGQAIAIRNTLIKIKPEHTLAQRALYLVAQNYHALAWYSRAADYYERFARGFPGEAQAPEALQNAIVFRVGRGEHEQARANARLFARSYGGRPQYAARAAAVSFSLGAIFEARGEAEAVVRHYQRYLRRWGARGGKDLQLRAHVKIARALWERSCPIKGVDGACVRMRRERSRRTLVASWPPAAGLGPGPDPLRIGGPDEADRGGPAPRSAPRGATAPEAGPGASRLPGARGQGAAPARVERGAAQAAPAGAGSGRGPGALFAGRGALRGLPRGELPHGAGPDQP